MLETYYLGDLRNLVTVSAMALMLSGCLVDEEVALENSQANTDTDYEISGSVGDGPVVGAAMRVTRNDGFVLAEFQSDASAGYNIVVRTRGKYYPLMIDAEDGTDLVTNLNPDFTLLGAALEPSKKSVANVNPFSTLTIEIARDLPDGFTKSNIQAAQDIVVTAMNSGLTTLTTSGPIAARIDNGNVAEIVKSSEALGEIVRRTRDWLQVAGIAANGNSTIQALGSDLIDRVIDGAGGPRADARTAAIASIVAAQVLLESMSNEIHVNGADATAALEAAISQIIAEPASPGLGELTATAEMLAQINVGLAAAIAVSNDPQAAGLRQTVVALQPGLRPALVRSILPPDYRRILDDVLALVATASDETIAAVNDVVRNGGTGPAANRVPTIQGAPASSVEAGSAYQFTPSANDDDGDSLTFSVSNRPAWSSFDPATGALMGMPAETDVGTYQNIAISVSDGQSTVALPVFSIAVTSAISNSPPEISGIPQTDAIEGSPYTFIPTATDADNDPLTFNISGAPTWLVFSTSTGELSGTPTAADVGVHGGIVISVSDGTATSSLPVFSIAVAGVVSNSPPVISGTPTLTVTAGSEYAFVPTASDPEGDSLTFSVTGLPVWAVFSASTGGISGTPGDADVGIYSNITITVSDGSESASLGPFSITVENWSLGSTTLTWTAPTQNEDGTALTDLAGYKIYWGTIPGSYPNSITINNPGITTYVVENLAPGTYEFVSTSFNTSGVESQNSNTASKTIP